MVCFSIDSAIKSNIFDDIYVSTEDTKVAEISKECGARIIERPIKLSSDLSTVVDVCLHAIKILQSKGDRYENLCVLLATSPLRTFEDILNAHNLFVEQKGSDFLMAVTDYLFDPFCALEEVEGYLEPAFQEDIGKKRQEHPRIFVDNGAIYIVKLSEFLRLKTFYGPKLTKYYMPFERSIDVDTEVEFRMAEYFLEKKI